MTRRETATLSGWARKARANSQAITKCFPTSRCLSSSPFIFTIERAAEVSEARRT